MRIACEVQTSDHQQCVAKPGKPAFTRVSLGRKPGAREEDAPVYLMLCTAQNRNGTKYKVKGNVQQVFAKFLKEGKATIRFISPPHDIAFRKADPKQLCFLIKCIKEIVEGKTPTEKVLSTLAPASRQQVEKPPTSLRITSPSEYPMSFPKSLTHLLIMNCSLRRLSPSIMALNQLVSLDVQSNNLTSLPEAFHQLTSLQCLNISYNKFTEVPSVLYNSSLKSTLYLLNMRNNELQMLPQEMDALQELHDLYINHNKVQSLPESLGFMPKLQAIHLNDNQLEYLPCTMLQRHYSVANLDDNPFSDTLPDHLQGRKKFRVATMKECAARVVVAFKIPYTYEDLDLDSMAYLKQAHFCICGKPCFESSVVNLHITRFPASFTGGGEVPFLVYLCSTACMAKYQYGLLRGNLRV